MRHVGRPWLGTSAGALLALPAAAAGQVVGGVVVEQVSLAPARGAVVTMFRADTGSGELAAAVTTADEAGAFWVELPGPGAYRAQADAGGFTSPLSTPLEVAAGDTLLDVALVVPSRLLAMAYACPRDAEAASAVVVGHVRDPATEVVLPSARVTASWREGAVIRWGDAEADAAGRYRICGVAPTAGTVRIRAELLGRQGPWEEVPVKGPSVVFHDLGLGIRTRAAAGPQDVIRDRIQMEAAARGLGDLSGQLHDQMSGRPMPYAVVRMEGTSHQALADAEGQFIFEGIQPGAYALEIYNLGATVRSEPVEVPPGQNVFVGLRVASQVVALEGLVVTTRSAVERITRLMPFRRDVSYGEAMALEENRGSRAFEILGRISPGLRIREVTPELGPAWICVESNRRVFRVVDAPSCEQVEVILDGMRNPEGALVLRSLPASEIESIEFLPAVQAQQMYGTFGNTANGAVVIFTRGRGPYTSPLRNRR
ncbi:MAG TPA: carboxypeptidase regulatory-like domain-containing protein [Longimicrobiales bacterium]|nr:carboxypeptidase regulatory-like domain-containing protein [Longimicrobiales bacterium]